MTPGMEDAASNNDSRLDRAGSANGRRALFLAGPSSDASGYNGRPQPPSDARPSSPPRRQIIGSAATTTVMSPSGRKRVVNVGQDSDAVDDIA